jgi:hypothetical protein
MGKPGGDDLPYLFSGTMVVQGKGNAFELARRYVLPKPFLSKP